MGKVYLTADEVAEALGISKGHAYVLIRECNNELRKKRVSLYKWESSY